jgi:uncharacterized protein DUF4115
MPQTLLQRIVATVMLIASALLIVLIIRETARTDEPQAVAATAEVLNAVSPATTSATPTIPATTEATAPREVRPRAAPKPAPAQPLTRLVLVASGGDSWLDVRSGSAQGKVLYAGTLAQGGKVDVKAKRLWVRFGAASHLTAQLNGKPLPLRLGTYNALISPGGLQFVAG